MFDHKVPQDLKKIQTWFGAIIARGTVTNSRINSKTPSGNSIVDEAAKYIAPSPTLQPWERMEIYNQQYWWRLLNIMHEIFPLAVRLFGYKDFNALLATPFLEKYPVDTWSLNNFAERFPQWILDNYHESDKMLIHDAICVDLAFNRGFFAEDRPHLQFDRNEMENFLQIPVTLQPWITVFRLPYDLFPFRAEVIKDKDGDYFLDHPLPKLDKAPSDFIVYRDFSLNMRWDRLEAGEYDILSRLKNGMTLKQASAFLPKNLIQQNLPAWLSSWTSDHWLVKYE